MYSIKENIENTYIIKKSKFITKLYEANNIDEINSILSNLKNEYKDSTHICYGYIVDNKEKCSDDGEPSGTAGIPILNILKKNNLTNILAVVIRYFGGIKLGAGGLTRAYSNSVNDTIKLSNIIELTEGYLVELEFAYDQVKLIDYILNDKNIISKEYNDNIIYKFYLSENELSFIPELEKVAIHLSIKEKVLIFIDRFSTNLETFDPDQSDDHVNKFFNDLIHDVDALFKFILEKIKPVLLYIFENDPEGTKGPDLKKDDKGSGADEKKDDKDPGDEENTGTKSKIRFAKTSNHRKRRKKNKRFHRKDFKKKRFKKHRKLLNIKPDNKDKESDDDKELGGGFDGRERLKKELKLLDVEFCTKIGYLNTRQMIDYVGKFLENLYTRIELIFKKYMFIDGKNGKEFNIFEDMKDIVRNRIKKLLYRFSNLKEEFNKNLNSDYACKILEEFSKDKDIEELLEYIFNSIPQDVSIISSPVDLPECEKCKISDSEILRKKQAEFVNNFTANLKKKINYVV